MSWQFTVSIPQWIQGKDSEGENIVLYRVNILLQAPDALANQSKSPFFVLRRYSHFRQLYEQLKSQLPEVMRERGLTPPPKHALHISGQKEMQDKRKEELERWLWRLISKPELSRSQALRGFLEIEKAVTRFQQQRASIQDGLPAVSGTAAASPLSGSRSLALTAMGAEAGPSGSDFGDWDDSRSEMSGISLAPSSVFSHLHTPASALQHQQQSGNAFQKVGVGSSGGGGTALSASTASVMRLGFKLAARGDVRRLVDVLEQRLMVAGRDMQAAISEMQMLGQAHRLMGQRVVELEGQLQGGRSCREVAMEHELAQLKLASDASVRAVSVELEDVSSRLEASEEIRMEVCSRLAEAEARLADCEARLVNAEAEVAGGRSHGHAAGSKLLELEAALADMEATSTSRIAMLTQQVSSLQQQLSGAHGENSELLSKLRDWGVSAQVPPAAPEPEPEEPGASERLELELQAARARIAEAESEVVLLQDRALQERDKVRSNQVLLAREIKKLRAELTAATEAQTDVELEQQLQQQRNVTETTLAVQLQQLEQQLILHEARAQEDQRLIQFLQQQLTEAAAAAPAVDVPNGVGRTSNGANVSQQTTTVEAATSSSDAAVEAVDIQKGSLLERQLRDQILELQSALDAADKRGPLADSVEAIEESPDRSDRLSEKLREADRVPHLEAALEAEQQRSAAMERDLSACQSLLAQTRLLLEEAWLKLQSQPAGSVFEAEKSAAVEQAEAAGRVMELQQQLAVARAERQEAEQGQAALEADLGQQLRQAHSMLAAKELEVAQLGDSVEEVRATAAAAAAGREAELGAQVRAVEVELGELRSAAAARAELAAKLEAALQTAMVSMAELESEVRMLRGHCASLEAEASMLRAQIEQSKRQLQSAASSAASPRDAAPCPSLSPEPSSSRALLVSGVQERLEEQMQDLQSELDAKEASNLVLCKEVQDINSELVCLRASLQPVGSSPAGLAEAPAGEPSSRQEAAKRVSLDLDRQLLEALERIKAQDLQIQALDQRLAILLTVEQQCSLLQGQVAELQQLQIRTEQLQLQAQQQQQRQQQSGLVAGPSELEANLISLDAEDAVPPSHPLPPQSPYRGDEDLTLDLSGLTISESSGLGLSAGEGIPGHARSVNATTCLGADVEGVVSVALDEARGLLQQLREAEVRAAKLADSSSLDSAAGAGAALDTMLGGFADIGDALQRTRAAVGHGLRQPSLLAPASGALRAAELEIRAGLADVLEELAGRGAALNEARCDRLLGSLMVAEAAPVLTVASPESQTWPAPAGGYAPPVFTASGQQQSDNAGAMGGGVGGGGGGGPNVLGALGQRMSEAVNTQWSGLGSAFGRGPASGRTAPGAGSAPQGSSGGVPRGRGGA